MEISILIVDDDRYLVEKLEETVQWEKIGISTVFTAYNIRQAQKLLEEVTVQILLCDIDMPQGSGLELLEWVRSRKQRTECVFLSSYANFAYAQKALRLSTREYLLKPITNQELEIVLAEVVREYITEKNEEDVSGRKTDDSRFWKAFFEEITGHAAMLKEAVREGRYRREDVFYLLLLRVCADPRADGYRRELMLFHNRLCSLAAAFFKKKNAEPEAVVRVLETAWVLVVKKTENQEAFCEISREWKKHLEYAVPQNVSMYIGQARPFMETGKSWERLEELEKRFLPGADGILEERSMRNTGEEGYERPPWEVWQKSAGGEIGQICPELCERLQKSFEAGTLTYENADRFLKELEQFLYGYFEKHKLSFLSLFDSQEFVRKERDARRSLCGAQEFVRWIFGRLEGSRQFTDDSRDVVEQVKQYIETHLGSDLSRSLLAKEVYLSQDYVSKLFKSTTGMTLPSYIAARRIERAKEYLRQSALPVSRIAMEVGYSNFSYFSKTFRDMTGMTPNEYRSNPEKL